MKKNIEQMLARMVILGPFFDKLGSGQVLAIILAWLFRILALLVTFGVLWVLYQIVSKLSSDMPLKTFFGLFLATLVVLLSSFLVVNVLLYRGLSRSRTRSMAWPRWPASTTWRKPCEFLPI